MTMTTTINQALQTFLRGVSFTRGLTHPYLPEQVGPLWVMRDAPRKNKKYRTEEWVAFGLSPAKIDKIVQQEARGRFAICAILANDELDEAMRAEFKALNYRLINTEPLMIHSLQEIPIFDEPAAIEQVLSWELADRVNKAARARQLLPEHLPKSDAEDERLRVPIRQYVAQINGEIVGRLASVVVDNATWVSNVYVTAEFRRQGIARAMMSQMLHDDKAAGAQQSVLLASHTGAKLYPIMGYEQIGMLYIYSPKKE